MFNGNWENFAKLMVAISKLSKAGYIFTFTQNKDIAVTYPDGKSEDIKSVDDLIMWVGDL